MVIMEGTEQAFAADMGPTHFVYYNLIAAFEHTGVLRRHSKLRKKKESYKVQLGTINYIKTHRGMFSVVLGKISPLMILVDDFFFKEAR